MPKLEVYAALNCPKSNNAVIHASVCADCEYYSGITSIMGKWYIYELDCKYDPDKDPNHVIFERLKERSYNDVTNVQDNTMPEES